MVATMNPSGDFGKKELSPALRNRMTEIWVESYFGQAQLQALYKDTNVDMTMPKQVSMDVDLFLIVKKICEDKELPNPIPLGIFSMICFMCFPMAKKYFALHRKALSIRDILAMTEFLQVHSASLTLKTAFIQAVELVIIDGVCLGIDCSSK
jgi:midasin